MGVERAVSLHEPGLEGVLDHDRGLVEAGPSLVHLDPPEVAVLTPAQAPAEAQPHSTAREMVQHRDLLRHPERLVPGEDDRPSRQVDALGPSRQIGEHLDVVGAEAVIVEVVLDRPQGAEPELFGQESQRDLLVVDLAVSHPVIAVRGEDHLHPDFHGPKT